MAKRVKDKKQNPIELIKEELSPLGHGRMFRGRVGKPDKTDPLFQETVTAYIALNMFAKLLDTRLAAIKPVLHQAAEEQGEQEETCITLEVDGNKVIRERRCAHEPDHEKLLALLETRGIDLKDVFDVVPKLVLNPSKLEFLVDTGKLKKTDVEPLHNVTWAIKVEASPALKTAFKKAVTPAEKSREKKPSRRTVKPA